MSIEGGRPPEVSENLDQVNGPSAVRYRIDSETEVYAGRLHIDAIEKFEAAHPELEVALANGDLTLEQGFITTAGRFVHANEALDIAHKSKQLKDGVIQRRSRLLSVDLKEQETKAVPEKIASAAIQYRGEIFTGNAHSDAWFKMTEKYPEATVVEPGTRLDGFLTNTGRFVSREEAVDIANRADQIKDEWKGSSHGYLSAEELKKADE